MIKSVITNTSRKVAAAQLTILAAAGLWIWCDSSAAQVEPAPITLEDIASRAGIRFVLQNASTADKHQIEPMVGGVAVFDYNNDGKPDIYFVNGAQQPSLEKKEAAFHNRLYRNQGDGKFADATVEAGVAGRGFETGVSSADYDNDGFADLFVAGVNRNTLYRNRGDGSFADVTVSAGISHKGWSIAAGWFDYDSDGHLDLFVVNYCAWNPEREPACRTGKVRTYCHPKYYEGLANQLYHNNGDGTFTDVSVSSGIGAHIGKGMSVAFLDFDRDGRLDAFVTNDTTPNFLFRNVGGGRFEEVALRSGVAFNDDGQALSSMGADARDADNDGLEDLFLTAITNETFPLFRNLGKGLFNDVTYPTGIGRQTTSQTGWSNGIYDFNNDGLKDLFAACGSIDNNVEEFSSRKSRQPNLLLTNTGKGFVDRSAGAGKDFLQPGWHRGAAFGDFDGDGKVDIVVTRIGEAAELFRNTSPVRNHWLALRLKGRRSNRDAIGAVVKVVARSGGEQWNRVSTSVGYASASDRTVYFGMGKDSSAERVEITWPSGARQTLRELSCDRYVNIEEP